MNMKIYPGITGGCVIVPSSKSIAHRSLICAALGRERSTISCRGLSEDIMATIGCLKAMGADIVVDEYDSLISVEPINIQLSVQNSYEKPVSSYEFVMSELTNQKIDSSEKVHLYCGGSGSTLRFLLPVLGALNLSAVIHMDRRLSERPLEPYLDVLRQNGMKFEWLWDDCKEEESAVLYVSGRLTGGKYCVPGNISSQYITGLLLALPMLERDSVIEITGKIESLPYIEMTEQILEISGISFDRRSQAFKQTDTVNDTTDVTLCKENQAAASKQAALIYHIPGRQHINLPYKFKIEGDYSNGAFFLCIGALSDNEITVKGLNRVSKQGDRKILNILKELGAKIRIINGDIVVSTGDLRTVEKDYIIDVSQIPDLVPVLSVVCALHKGTVKLINTGRLRFKESDRINSTVNMLKTLGADIRVLSIGNDDEIIIQGVPYLHGGVIDSAGDHRIAMSAVVAASGLENRDDYKLLKGRRTVQDDAQIQEICDGKPECINIVGFECVNKSYPGFLRDYCKIS